MRKRKKANEMEEQQTTRWLFDIHPTIQTTDSPPFAAASYDHVGLCIQFDADQPGHEGLNITWLRPAAISLIITNDHYIVDQRTARNQILATGYGNYVISHRILGIVYIYATHGVICGSLLNPPYDILSILSIMFV